MCAYTNFLPKIDDNDQKKFETERDRKSPPITEIQTERIKNFDFAILRVRSKLHF